VSWSINKEVCAQFQPQQYFGGVGLVFGDPALSYDDLTPQVIWRGTDFPFLNLQNNLDQPDYEDYIEGNIEPNTADPLADAIAIMRDNYSRLVPRWQGVVLTAEAEQEARRTNNNSLPKVNIKFSSARGKGKPAAVGNPKYKQWEDIGFPLAGHGMPPEEMAKFKYHIDIGGGGGLCSWKSWRLGKVSEKEQGICAVYRMSNPEGVWRVLQMANNYESCLQEMGT